jgi:GT2 family glycosyltransferase
VHKQVALRIGGFDPRLPRLEDVDFGIRINNAGIKIYHDGSVMVNHFHVPKGGGRDYIQSWQDKYLAGLSFRNLGAMSLILWEQFSLIVAVEGLIKTLFHYVKPNRLYLKKFNYIFLVLKEYINTLHWIMTNKKKGPFLGNEDLLSLR